jgi:hypothetical protein
VFVIEKDIVNLKFEKLKIKLKIKKLKRYFS